MANFITYISAAVAFILIVLLFLVAWFQNSVKKRRLLATPSIAKEKAVLTSFASARISAPVDDVFAALLNYKNYSKWSCQQYSWQASVDGDGAPPVGTKGSFKILEKIPSSDPQFMTQAVRVEFSVEGFREKTLPVILTVLDKEKKLIAEKTISYPSWLLGSEKVQEVVPVDGHPRLCEYRTWHSIEGLASYALALTAQEELSETQRTIADGLKSYMEKSRAKTAMF